jgi:hypothetical protein
MRTSSSVGVQYRARLARRAMMTSTARIGRFPRARRVFAAGEFVPLNIRCRSKERRKKEIVAGELGICRNIKHYSFFLQQFACQTIFPYAPARGQRGRLYRRAAKFSKKNRQSASLICNVRFYRFDDAAKKSSESRDSPLTLR